MEFGDILKNLREKENLSREDLCSSLNLSYSALSKYETNIRFPDKDTLKKIALYFHVSIDYLLDFDTSNGSTYRAIPIIGRIRAGLPILATENFEGEIDLSQDIKGDFALRVQGDSMSWVGIHDGDLAIFKQSSIANHGDIVAAGVEENEWHATLKFFIQENGIPLLRAANPEYQDMEFTAHHRIIGRLVGIYKNPPSVLTYKDFLVKKDLINSDWQDTIETAVGKGLDAKQMNQMIELFAHMVKQIK